MPLWEEILLWAYGIFAIIGILWASSAPYRDFREQEKLRRGRERRGQ